MSRTPVEGSRRFVDQGSERAETGRLGLGNGGFSVAGSLGFAFRGSPASAVSSPQMYAPAPRRKVDPGRGRPVSLRTEPIDPPPPGGSRGASGYFVRGGRCMASSASTGPGGDQHPFQEPVGVGLKVVAVLEGCRALPHRRLTGPRSPGARLLPHQLPLLAGGGNPAAPRGPRRGPEFSPARRLCLPARYCPPRASRAAAGR